MAKRTRNVSDAFVAWCANVDGDLVDVVENALKDRIVMRCEEGYVDVIYLDHSGDVAR